MNEKKRDCYKLTHPQKRIWYIEKINTDSQLHNIGGCLKINKNIDVKCMEQTLNIIIKDNDGLRLRFNERNNEPVQYVKKFEYESIEFVNFTNYEEPKNEHKKWVKGLFEKNFNLDDSKLYYFAIYKISDNEFGVLLKIHHIICDGWGITLIQSQICKIYTSIVNNREFDTEECSSYIDFIEEEKEYLSSERFIKNKNFWKEKFNNMPEEFLYNTSNSLEGKRQCFNVDNDLSNIIRNFIIDKKCSLNTFFIAILLIYINKSTYKNDIVIGTPVFNRTSKNQKSMIGMFTSTLPFRFKLNRESNIEDLIKRINKDFKLCLVHQKYPYDFLIKDLDLSKDDYNSLFKMSVNYYNSKYESNINGIKAEVEEYYCGNQSYSLQVIVKELDNKNIELDFDYKILEYTDGEIKTMYASMINIINQVIKDEKLEVNEIKLINEEERKCKVYDWNSTTEYYPKKMVNELFEDQVIKKPDKVVVEFNSQQLTYKQLNEKANQLANYLREKEINKKSIVVIIETNSIDLIVSILAVLKAGAAYLPIDPSYPIERISYMIEDSKSNIVLTNLKIEEIIESRITVINVKDINLDIYNKENLVKTNDLDDLAYIIYTSGSTGRPKGVMIEHKGLTNYIWWANKMYLKDDNEIMALYSSISFDLTITSIFTPLISGNKIVVYDNDETEFVLYKILRENKVTVLKLTPAHLTLLKDMDNTKSNIKRFIVGGEDLKVNLAEAVYNSFGKNIEIYNEYGPTETVVGCMICKYDEEKNQGISVPIGYPVDNVQVYILDNELNAIPTGFVGELYVSGDGVARGYLNREELTKERFIENPFIEGKRMYRTGDTARYLENGTIEYVSRVDNQVKIRGHRIELGEIEKHLTENEFVKDAVVVFKENLLGNKLLNAYIVKNRQINESELNEWLLKFLPKYMVPTNFIFMDRLPLTVNGKIDYSLLPEKVDVTKEFVNYSTSSEKELVKVIEEILGVENVSMNDNYYQLGGDSIKAIQISSKLKNKGLTIKVKDILSYDSIQKIAEAIETGKETVNISQDESYGEIENTPIIEWFFNQKFENENLYNQYVLLEYNKCLDIKKVIIAVNNLVKHHDGLRINYNRKTKKLYYNDKHLNVIEAFRYIDLKEVYYDEEFKNVEYLIDKANVSFDIEDSLLFNVIMFDLEDKKQALLFIAHHLVVDGVSWRVILNDFVTILNNLEKGNEISLPMKTYSFKEWSNELITYSKKDFQNEISYWNNIYNSNFNYPIDFNKGKDIVKTSQEFKGILDADTLNSLIEGVNEIYSMNLNEVLVMALILTINSITKNDEVVIEFERHGRENIGGDIDISRTVGWFTSMYPAYFKVESNDIERNIKSIKEQLRNIPNQGFNYGTIRFLKNQIAELQNKLVRFNYLGDFDNIVNKEKLSLSSIEFGLNSDEENSLTALIDIVAMIVNKELKINVTYSKNKFNEETIQKLIDTYISTLKLIKEKCMNKDVKEFTPSDFASVDISQEDLDVLFD
ncbi:non-ribosomal peptide synthase domain TIGR01720/amino acid adenylation domain-containing protein [Clostridium cavendishii DSM 21758]|uniref:Non-ribosomal peptide synthase domain TIGR01720/amino acid adenylation domain-containing protein n=1 Tax=Clostridium cavendishii DSM 21758 TaxID=1121302 RepID=A0A1M6MUH1_9CLOT|nr:non-ribosomal peptide synthetase [Clostridium cavendishii]SHJ87072.1 non-ribosomal peptide synthase domain TIGR01720/amino acid adenylation domain-containing protein [Clostridium cavendishii DSM 21758]